MGDRKPLDQLSQKSQHRLSKRLQQGTLSPESQDVGPQRKQRRVSEGNEPDNILGKNQPENIPEADDMEDSAEVDINEEEPRSEGESDPESDDLLSASSDTDGDIQESGSSSGDEQSSGEEDMDANVPFVEGGPRVNEPSTDNIGKLEIDNRPLYEGAPISFVESFLAILSLVIAHNISGVLLADILVLINLHLITQNNIFKKTLYKVKTYLKDSEGPVTKHFFCCHCLARLDDNSQCTTCEVSPKKTSYFVTLSIVSQIKEMFARPGFTNLLKFKSERSKRNDTNIEDVYDGKLYRKMMDRGFLLGQTDISFLWYSDGVPVFKSSKCSMYPFFLAINELPYKYRFRKENLILAGMWVGTKKPPMNAFIKAMSQDFKDLKDGVKIKVPSSEEPITVHGILLCGTCDLPCKSDCLNFKGFMGYHGCCVCEEKGERLSLPTGGSVQVFPYEPNQTLRTSKSTCEYANTAVRINKDCRGVKGHSYLSKLMPDFVQGMAIDVMHGVFSGVCKKLMELWFESKHSAEPFSLTNVMDVISTRLMTLQPPNFIERLPRSLDDLCHWKATEFRSWFYYYSPVLLADLMKGEYYQHYLSLVKAVCLLSSNSISGNDISTARELIKSFVRKFDELYGVRFSSINIHQLLHLPECVENLGPLWAYSCFRFEDLNGQYLKVVHGTRYVLSQISKFHWYGMTLPRYLALTRDKQVHDFLTAKRRRNKLRTCISDGCYSVDVSYRLDPVPFAVTTFMNQNDTGRSAWKYCRLFKNGFVYTGTSYARSCKTFSSCVEYTWNGSQLLGAILHFIKFTNCTCQQRCEHEGHHFAYVEQIDECDESFTDYEDLVPTHLRKVNLSGRVRLIPVADIINMCMYLDFDNTLCVGKLVNIYEFE